MIVRYTVQTVRQYRIRVALLILAAVALICVPSPFRSLIYGHTTDRGAASTSAVVHAVVHAGTPLHDRVVDPTAVPSDATPGRV